MKKTIKIKSVEKSLAANNSPYLLVKTTDDEIMSCWQRDLFEMITAGSTLEVSIDTREKDGKVYMQIKEAVLKSQDDSMRGDYSAIARDDKQTTITSLALVKAWADLNAGAKLPPQQVLEAYNFFKENV